MYNWTDTSNYNYKYNYYPNSNAKLFTETASFYCQVDHGSGVSPRYSTNTMYATVYATDLIKG